MSNDNPDSESVAISATDVIEPASREVIETVNGVALVFVLTSDGRRFPLASIAEGQCMVGCAPTENGDRLLVTGQRGTHVRRRALEHSVAANGTAAIEHWIWALGEASLGGRWVDRVVAPGDEVLRLAPGENVMSSTEAIASSDHSIQGWLSVTSGSASYCGWSQAQVGVLDAAVPVTRGVWVTSGLRCRIEASVAPTDSQEWAATLDLMGRLAIQSAVARQSIGDTAREQRLVNAEVRAERNTQEAIDLLAGAIVGPIMRSVNPTDRATSTLSAGFTAARASGLIVSDEARLRATDEVSLGRDAVNAVAEACTARARTVDLAPSWHTVEGPPLVADLKRGGSVALLWKGRGWVAIDPTSPDEPSHVDAEYAELLESKATEFAPTLPAPPRTISDLSNLAFRGSGRDIAVVLVLSVGIAALSFFTPVVFGAIAGSFATIEPSTLVTSLLTLVLLLIVGTGWRYVRSTSLLRARVRSMAIASGAVWDRMMRLRATWHEGHTLGERMTQSTAVNTAAELVPDTLIIALLDTLAVLGSLTAVATTNAGLLAATAFLIALQIVVAFVIVKKGAVLTRARVDASAAATGRLMETLRAVNRLQVSGAEDRAFKRWAQEHAKLTSADLRLRQVTTWGALVLGMFPLLGLILIVGVTAASGATFAQFVTAQTAAAIATASVTAAVLSGGAVLNARAVLDKVDPVLEAIPEGFGDGVNPGIISGGLAAADIVFRYDPSGPAVLDGVSFRVQPGEHVAIVGPSGCGKTTLMRVLLGLEEPTSGVITVDGQDMASLDRPSVRRQIGCVLQSSTLLPGTIRDNIDMGRGLTPPQMWKALEAASVAEEVQAMGLGLDTPVIEGGGTVSGGQRQRILLARALAGEPRMLILDEATSALDNVTQAIVIDFLERMRLTRIVVAHRLSTIRTADRIIVLAAGKVEQEGTFEELMAVPGHFRDLAERQLTDV